MLKNETTTSEWQLELCEKLQNMMKNLYIIASFSGHVSGTDVDLNRPGKRRIRKILYGADCDAIWNNLWQNIPDQVFSATVSPEGGFKLCKYSLPATTGVLQHQGLMERADGAIRSRWTLILVNVQKLANNYPPLRSTGSNHKSNLKQREKMIFVICKHQLLFPKIFFKKIFVGHLLEKHEVHLIVVVDAFSAKFAHCPNNNAT